MTHHRRRRFVMYFHGMVPESVGVDLASIRAAPYRVEFGPMVDQQLRRQSR